MSNHIADANKMVSDTPRTDAAKKIVLGGVGGDWEVVHIAFSRQLERELNAANERIKSLIEERDRANRLADWKWNLRGEFESLLGTDKIEEGIEAVKELKRRIKQLEEAGDALFELCDASPIQFELVDQIPQRLKAWEEAKEDKP